jgi:hypothetical protein
LSDGVQPWVQEAQGWETSGDTSAVELRDDTVEGWGGTRGSAVSVVGAFVKDTEVLGLGGDIWESTAGSVVVSLVLVTDGLEVALDREVLVPWAREEIGETSGGEEDGPFGRDIAGSADGGYVWAGSWELGLEFGGVFSVVGETEVTGSGISRGEEDGFSTGTKLREELADLFGVGGWDLLLVFSI